MRIIKVFDSKNYQSHWKTFKRDSARAIIFNENRLVMIQSEKYGEYKFPGGGIEGNETHIDALIRETKEETGLDIIPSSIKEYGMTKILRRGFEADEIFEQDSFYYSCDVNLESISSVALDEYEIEYGYKLVFVSIEDAIKGNSKLLNIEKIPWVERELTVLNELRNTIILK